MAIFYYDFHNHENGTFDLTLNRTEYEGQVVSLYENNGYDDSDFFAVVFDGKEVKHIMYSTTRCYIAMDAVVDASPELLEEYKAYKQRKEREYRVQACWQNRQELIELRKQCGLESYTQLKKVKDVYKNVSGAYDGCLKLLKTKKFRSEFRKSLAEQLMKWILGESKFDAPFSYRQLQYL